MTSAQTALATLMEEAVDATSLSRKGTTEPSPMSTEVGLSPDAMDRSIDSSNGPSESRLQLDMEVVEEGTASTNSANFMFLAIPRERSRSSGGIGIQNVHGPLPTVLGRRDQSKNSSKSVAASYNLNPSSPQSALTLPRSPPTTWMSRWRREESRDEPGPSLGLGYLDTGAGASAMPMMPLAPGMDGAPDGTQKMPTDEELKEMAKQIPPPLLPMLKRLVEAAEEVNGGGTSTEEKPKATREVIRKIGNSDEADYMRRACFMWPEESCRKALKEVMDDDKKQPLTVNGAMLVMEEVVWAQPEDAEMWKKSLRMVASNWMLDQITADVPFIPPDSAKAHCFYLMDEKACDEWLVMKGFTKAGMTGKQLLDDGNIEREKWLGEKGNEKFIEAVQEEMVLFMKDLVVQAAKDNEKNET